LFEQQNRFAVAAAYQRDTPSNSKSERGRVERLLWNENF
jgi:hypothetical protein